MVAIPLVLTFCLFAFLSILNSPSLSNMGEYSSDFVILLGGILVSFFVGMIIGLIFSKFNKNESDNKKYHFAIIPIIYALTFALLAIILSKGNYNSSWWLVYVLKNPIFLVFGFIIVFTGFFYLLPVAEIVGYTGFLFGIFLYDAIIKRSSLERTSKLVCLTTLIVVISFTIIVSRDVIHSGITELVHGKSTIGNDLSEYDLLAIAPFKEGNGLAKLDKPASLQFMELDVMPRLDGATAAYPVYASFVEAVYTGLGEYYEANKDSNEKDIYTAFVASEEYPFDIIKCSKTSTAYERLIKGETDIIFVAEPSKAHLEEITKLGDEFVLTQIGSEAFVFFTNVKNPVESLTMKEIQDIYSGEITSWKEVGGRNRKITPYQRPENSGSQTIMQNWVMKDIEMQPPTTETYAGGMGEIIDKVSSYQNSTGSIGYSFMYYSSEMVKNNQIKYISVDGVKPTQETIINNTYPFTVPVYAVHLKSNKNENIEKFVSWILSEEGQSLVQKTGYTSNLN